MIRQLPFRAAVATSGRLLSTPISHSLLLTSARCLSTETATSTTGTSPPPSAISSQKLASSKSSRKSSRAAPKATPSAAAAPKPQPKLRRLSYAVERTPSKQLPVYDHSKSGGTRKYTQVRKIIGNTQDLKKDVIEELGFDKEAVVVNPVTLHLIIKGHHGYKVKKWLEARGF